MKFNLVMIQMYPFAGKPQPKRMPNYNPLDQELPMRIPHVSNSEGMRGKELFNANLVQISRTPFGFQSLNYGYGHGVPDQHEVIQPVRNRLSKQEVDLNQFANYYNFKK